MASWFTSTLLPILPLFAEPLSLVGYNRSIAPKPQNPINQEQVLDAQTRLQMSTGSGTPKPQFRLSSAPYVYDGPPYPRGALAVAVIAIGTSSIYLLKQRRDRLARGGREDAIEEFYQLGQVGVRGLLGDDETGTTTTTGGKGYEVATHQKKFKVVNNNNTSSTTGVPYQTRHDSRRD